MPAEDAAARPRRDAQEKAPNRRPESITRLAIRLCGMVLICLLLASAGASVVIVAGWSAAVVDRSPPPVHRICPECQRLLMEHGIKLVNPDFGNCDGPIHAAAWLKNKPVK
jgi:hypothetical protein